MDEITKKETQSCIYLLQEDAGRLKADVVPRCKIGMTSDIDPSFNQRRMQIIRSCSPEKLILRHKIDMPSKEVARDFEGFLHARFFAKRSFDYYSEWFDLTEEDVNWFCSLTFDALKDMVSKTR